MCLAGGASKDKSCGKDVFSRGCLQGYVMQERCVERWGLRGCRKDVFRVKKPSFSLFNTINRELQKVSYQIEVTSNIASDMLAFTRAPKELTRILKHSKGISIGIPREFVGIMKY